MDARGPIRSYGRAMIDDSVSALVCIVDAHATKWETDEFAAASQEWIHRRGLKSGDEALNHSGAKLRRRSGIGDEQSFFHLPGTPT